MAKQVLWNRLLYEEFLRLTYMDDMHRAVMDLHVTKCMTNYQIGMELHISEATVNKIIRECKDMYDSVQPYSDILPVREKHAREKCKLNA